MPERSSYRRQVLQAIEAFLEGTPSSRVQAQHIIQRCFAALHTEAMEDTLDQMIWHSFVVPLTDSVYYESEEYLREAREILCRQSLQNLATLGIGDDFRPSFTAEEAVSHAPQEPASFEFFDMKHKNWQTMKHVCNVTDNMCYTPIEPEVLPLCANA